MGFRREGTKVVGRFDAALLLVAILTVAPRWLAAQSVEGVARVDFFGYVDCVALQNSSTRVVLCHQAGGRVLEYAVNGKNALWLDPAQAGWVQPAESRQYVDLSGGRFDIGPEMLTPGHEVLWQGAWRVEVTGPRSARMTSAEDAATGVQLIRTFQLDAVGSGLRCTQTIRNVSARTVAWCHWSRTLAQGGGIGLVPLSPRSRLPKHYVMYEGGGLIQSRPVDPNIRVREGFLEILGTPKFPKLGMDSQVGWFAYAMPNNLLFVKRYPVSPEKMYGEVAGLTISLWYDRMVRCELEPIGPLEELKPGASASFTEEWRLEEFAFPAPGQSVDLREVEGIVSRGTGRASKR